MRDFYYLPVVDIEATGKHIKQLVEENEITLEQMKLFLYNHDNYNDPETNVLSDQTIYDWYAGKYLPELSKILRLSRLFRISVEELIIYKSEFVEVHNKKSKEHGTRIHSVKLTLYTKEENLTIEELQKKNPLVFEDMISKNIEYTHTYYENEFPDYFALNPDDSLFLIPDYSAENLKDGVIRAIKEIGYSNSVFETLYNTYRQKINGWKSKYTNPKSNLPDSQKTLAAIPKTENLLSLLRMANIKVADACAIEFIAQKNKKFDFFQYESNYEKIRYKKHFEKEYNKYVEIIRESKEAWLESVEEEYHERCKEYEKQSIENLVYRLDETLPEYILKKPLNHDVLVYLRKKYEAKMAKTDLSYGLDSYSFAKYIYERAKKENIFDLQDLEKFREYIIYMTCFKDFDDYIEYSYSKNNHTIYPNK